MRSKVFRRILVVPAVLIMTLAFVGGTADAQDLCVITPEYEGAITVTVSPTTAAPGDTVTVTGTGFPPNCGVEIVVGGQSVGIATTDGDGNFTFEFTVPPGTPPGPLDVTAIAQGLEITNEVMITGVTTTTPITITPVTTGPPLPVTGSNSLGLAGVGFGLVAAGGFVVLTVRKRAQRHAS